MNDPVEPEDRLAAGDEPRASRAGIYESRSDEPGVDTGTTSGGVQTYDRPATAERSGPNIVAILILLVILALLAYAAFQLLH